MPKDLFLDLSSRHRRRETNVVLGGLLAFVAGAINAGGFLAVHRYTSHMTGVVSAIADDLFLGETVLAMAGVSSLLAFMAGAATTAALINWARRRDMHGEFAIALLVEAVLLLIFGLLGANLELFVDVFVPSTVLLLCFIMGLQNAMITKISRAEIRTTHVTGVVTDLGIELGRMLYWNQSTPKVDLPPVQADWAKVRTLSIILVAFFLGGLSGAWAFKQIGFSATLPMALLLLAIAAPPLLQDLRDQRNKHLPRLAE
ncbi:MAG TPA: YoaK family protein [Aquabacterium sp.]|nr:YoaK family protein [Aquabacterium sp.]HRH28406.1 YoaK family protein [Aquabacterium sp.]